VLPGRILRINDDGSFPADNPFGEGNPTYALGLRNSFDFVFDPVSGEIFSSENGTSIADELNILPAGANGGWPMVEGLAPGAVEVDFGEYVDPVLAYDGIVVPTGLAFAPDATFGTGREFDLFVAEFLTGRIWTFPLTDDRTDLAAAELFVQGIAGGITDIEFAPDGTLFVLTSTAILRVVPEE
jgi:glucose/arabinose dehydrogenase